MVDVTVLFGGGRQPDATTGWDGRAPVRQSPVQGMPSSRRNNNLLHRQSGHTARDPPHESVLRSHRPLHSTQSQLHRSHKNTTPPTSSKALDPFPTRPSQPTTGPTVKQRLPIDPKACSTKAQPMPGTKVILTQYRNISCATPTQSQANGPRNATTPPPPKKKASYCVHTYIHTHVTYTNGVTLNPARGVPKPIGQPAQSAGGCGRGWLEIRGR